MDSYGKKSGIAMMLLFIVMVGIIVYLDITSGRVISKLKDRNLECSIKLKTDEGVLTKLYGENVVNKMNVKKLRKENKKLKETVADYNTMNAILLKIYRKENNKNKDDINSTRYQEWKNNLSN